MKLQNLKFKNKYVIATSGIAIALLCGAAYSTTLKNPQDTKILVSELTPQTPISYEVYADGKEIYKDDTKTNEDGTAQLFVPKTDDAQDLAFKVKFGDKLGAIDAENQALNMVMSINKKEKKIDLSGSVPSNGDAKLSIDTGEKNLDITPDWAGLFSESVQAPKDQEAIQLAFQKFNAMGDLDPTKSGKVDVFFGDSSADGIGDVRSRYTSALIRMTEQLSAVMVQQTLIIGAFLDAKMQLTVQRKMQELMARAHKDYHPSEQICRIGTFVKSISHTETKSELNKQALNKLLMEDYLGVDGHYTFDGENSAIPMRIKQYQEKYCDPRDNNRQLQLFCSAHDNLTSLTNAQRSRLNKDIDYARTMYSKLTYNADFSDATATDDEEDLIALARNLYYPEMIYSPTSELVANDVSQHYKSRSYAAKQNVAHNSFINIVGMKSSAPAGPAGAAPLTEDSGWTYMKALLREFGVDDGNASGSTDDEINAILGDRPSYYAQMEVLTKKIYQSPNFYTNLYDKPANVDRIGASLDAISIMSQRDRFDSMLRTEMLAALLVEEAIVNGDEVTITSRLRNISGDQQSTGAAP